MKPMPHHYHLVGIAGVGMNALAQLLRAGGHHVSGSDRTRDQGLPLPVLERLERLDIAFHPQDGTGITGATKAVIVSSAIEPGNADLAAAARYNVPVMHRADILAQQAAGRRLVGVAGTAGKTTLTGMIGWTLEQLGADPTVVNGGALINWRTPGRIGNFRAGQSDCWVLELDESDRSLLKFQPDMAVITNISRDHFELEEVRDLFTQFTRRVRRAVLGCRPPADRMPAPDGFSPQPTPDGMTFTYRRTPFQLRLPGAHNAENALLCAMLCERLGYALEDISAALSEFRGIERRLEHIATIDGMAVYDDYAHNPVKIAAAWQALASRHHGVTSVWRPHGFAPLELMWDDLLETFTRISAAGPLLLLPVYYAGGTAARRRGSGQLAEAVNARGGQAETVADYDALAVRLRQLLRPGGALLLMGARDPGLPVFARDFAAQLGNFLAVFMPGPA